jgi:sec-independent protein translocase protein TatC
MALFKRKKTAEAGEMSFIDHLEELRWHIIRSLIAVLVGAVVVFINSNVVVDKVLLGPAHDTFITYDWLCNLGQSIGAGNVLCMKGFKAAFQSTIMTEQFMATFTIAFVCGFILAFPYVFWELWRFIRPALTDNELKRTRGIIFWVSLLFFIGVAFGYFVLTPFMVNFYFSYQLSPLIEIKPTFSDYVENLIYLTVGIGVLFQLPMLVMFLAKIGLVSPTLLRTYRKHAVVAILIAAAIITPTTDPFSLTLVALPLYALFEASIAIAARVYKERERKEVEEWS